MLKIIKKNYFLIISIFFVGYFFFNLLSGERGLISFFEKKQILSNLKKDKLLLSKFEKKFINKLNKIFLKAEKLNYPKSSIAYTNLYNEKN